MRILSLSLDQELASFRQFALSGAQHEVNSLTSEKEIVAACKGDAPYDTVLLCHTLPGALARQLVRLLRENKPSAQTVFIAHQYGEWPEVEADRYAVGADGPEALVRLLDEMRRTSDEKQPS